MQAWSHCLSPFPPAYVKLVQAVDRALIIDVLPSFMQPSGNAWAARMLGLGSVVGFFM
jgi:solute carrier family 45, member 1/2/4